MRSYVTFLWGGARAYRPEHVNVLAHALKYWDADAKFICVTDQTGFSPLVETFPMPKEAEALGALGAPQGKDFPSSYRRLWCFSEAATALGERIMLFDIDAMVVGPVRDLWDTEGDFVGWRPLSIWGREDRIGGGTWMLRTGTVSCIWERFIQDPQKLIDDTRAKGWNGSDQAIMSRFLKSYPTWPQFCGIYGSQDGVLEWELPPEGAKIVHFNGAEKAWRHQSKAWIRAYYEHFAKPPEYDVRGLRIASG